MSTPNKLIEELIEKAERSDDLDVQWFVADFVSNYVRAKPAKPYFQRMLNHEDPELRRLAGQALAELGP